MNIYWVYLSCLLFCALIAFLNRQALKTRQLFPFVPFLWFVLIQEVTIYIYTSTYPNHTTGLFYNIYSFICAIFFVLIYSNIITTTWFRRIVFTMLALYLAGVIITYLFIQKLTIYNSYLGLASGFIITSCGVLFLYHYFNLDNTAKEKELVPVIWLTIGIIVFYPVVNISFAFYKYLVAYHATFYGLKLYRIIPQLMSIFMYGCFIYAFHLCKTRKWI